MCVERRWMCPFPPTHPSVCSLEITGKFTGLRLFCYQSQAIRSPRCTQAAGNSHERVPSRGLLQWVSWGRRCISAPIPWPKKPFLELIPRVDMPPAAQKKNCHFPEKYLQPAKRTYCSGRPLGSGGIFISKQPSLLSSALLQRFTLKLQK